MDHNGRTKPIKVLVAAGHLVDPRLLQASQLDLAVRKFEWVQVEHLQEVIARLRPHHNPQREVFDVLLLDLKLADCQGLDTFLHIYAQASEVPIVVLIDADPVLALALIREGAQDCLFKSEVDGEKVRRALLFAVERHRTWAALQQMCLTDDLTGLLNRRGFWSMAKQQVKIASREGWQLMLLFADLDGLKKVNDTFGHPEGDRALRLVAKILNETFRTSDLIARLGGDEFIVMAPNVAPAGIAPITSRLQGCINRHNAALPDYQLSLSWGVVSFDPRQQSSLDEVIFQADQALYQHKHSRDRTPIE